jgi:hypothetical protein
MNKPPLFICPPRTRSTYIMLLTKRYMSEKFNMHMPKRHMEFFGQFVDYSHNEKRLRVVRDHTKAQMIPILVNNEVYMTGAYPHVFESLKDQNLYKINFLKHAKSRGIEVNVKCTHHISNNIDDILDFYNDRNIVLLKRKSSLDLILSYLFAKHINLFVMRSAQWSQLYDEHVSDRVIIKDYAEDIESLIIQIKKLYDIDCETIYYEDLDNEKDTLEIIGNIFKDDKWHTSLDRSVLPIRKDTDYSKAIINYDEIVLRIQYLLDQHNL